MQQQQQLPPPPPLTGANALPVQPNRQQYQQVNRVEQNNDQPPPPAPLGRNVYEDPHLCMVVFVTEPMDRQSVHRRSMEVNAVMPAVPKYMPWSDQEITWSFKDHPKVMPNPGGYALVVDPIMKGPETRVKFSKVLIDNGSSINIMYKHTMRVPRELAEHSLNVRKDAKPVRQPLRRFAEDRRKIIGEEVTKLLVAGFIVEVTHTEWLANPVLVEKKKDENLEAQLAKVWRMCIDYTNLNKACPRDPFPLPRIDQVIDSTAGYLVVQQCSGDWDAKDANMASYRFHVQKIAGFFEGCEFHHVPRAENEAADTLSKEPGDCSGKLGEPVNSGTATPVPEEAMLVDSMDIDMPVFVVREAPSWVEPIKEFLINGTLPVDENESRRIQRRSKAYTIINGEVYKRSVTGVLQRCVEPEEGKEMLEEIHRGECGHHASSRALVAKVFRHGFYS
ncbi:hypothetical protein QYE76_067090 [Lolium multiflorum]|uniref:RNase H type-1 domain-containing protein n=1 Tax=Lolium multiflorum TaxID=4521 RepID=A0AAD8SC43_LOLMU|nr:hypothetical protein QYE76_067090 [Lolium multiflorum]